MSPLRLSDEEIQELSGITKICLLPYSILQRARPVFAYSDMETHCAIANQAKLMAVIISKSPNHR